MASVPSSTRRCLATAIARRRRRALERVHPHGTARAPRLSGLEPSARASAPYSPFGIEHGDLSAEGRLPEQVRLHKGALPASDLAEHRDIGICHRACRVQLEGVMGEGAASEVLADEHAARRERRRGGEGVCGAELGRSRLVRRQFHAHPRPVGKVQV